MKDTDRNFYSVADVDGRILEGLRLVPDEEGQPAGSFDDILKFSNARNIQAKRLWVAGGSENAVDMNRRCVNVNLSDTRLESGEQCAVVIKGGSEDISLSHVSIAPGRRATAYDIELGGWSDQSMQKTRGVRLYEVWRTDGQPVRVVVGWAERPTVVGGRVRILFWRSLALKLFCAGKFIATKLTKKS